jgi:hypothetical protein
MEAAGGAGQHGKNFAGPMSAEADDAAAKWLKAGPCRQE